MTSPDDAPMPNNQPANDDQPTTPMDPITEATMQIPHDIESPNFIERRYTLSVQQLFQAIHDQLTTGATFTLDEEDARTGMVRFHAFDGAQCTVTVTAEGALGSVIRMAVTNDDGNRRSKEFFTVLDRRLGVAQTIDPAGGDTSIYAPVMPKKHTSKLAVWGIIIGALFTFFAFASDSGPSWFLGFIAALLSGIRRERTAPNRGGFFRMSVWGLSPSVWLWAASKPLSATCRIRQTRCRSALRTRGPIPNCPRCFRSRSRSMAK